MRELKCVGQLTLEELEDLPGTHRRNRTISDVDFLETLAKWKCIIVPPYVLETHGDGTMRRVAPLTYDLEMNLDKPAILLDVIKTLRAGEEEEIGLHDISS